MLKLFNQAPLIFLGLWLDNWVEIMVVFIVRLVKIIIKKKKATGS